MNQESAEVFFEVGCRAQEARQWEQAAAAFQQATQLDPLHANAHMELGVLSYRGGELSTARHHLERSIDIDPSQSDPHMYLGIVLSRLNLDDVSEAHFRSSIGLAERPAIVHATFAEEFLWHGGRYAEAEHHFKEALELEPDLSLALRYYARMLACHGRDREAQAHYEAATRADPENQATKREFERFTKEPSDPTRDPRDNLRAAIARGARYPGAIAALDALDV